MKHQGWWRSLWIVGVLSGLLLGSFVRADTPNQNPLPLDLFNYTPPDFSVIKEIKTEQQGNVTVHSILYPSVMPSDVVTTPILAYLVLPAGEGLFPAIVYAHWLGNPKSNRDEFLAEAIEQAEQHHVASILVNNVFVYTRWYTGNPEVDRDNVIRQVADYRQALDILLAQPQVDPERVVFVGHDYGAMYGMVLAGVEPRIKGFVFMTGVSHFTDWTPFRAKKEDADYLAAFALVDPLTYLGHVQVPVLLQYGDNDIWVSEAQRAEFADMVTDQMQMVVYTQTGHDLKNDQAYTDRNNWIQAVFQGTLLDFALGDSR